MARPKLELPKPGNGASKAKSPTTEDEGTFESEDEMVAEMEFAEA
jgi:hypothetical protein